MRDLVRARGEVRGDLMRARHLVGKLLLRHDLRFTGNNWTESHRQWLARMELCEPVARRSSLDRRSRTRRRRFAACTEWAFGLEDEVVGRITRNVLDLLLAA